ncbi:dTDP-4-dehydrorhamnose reductase [Paraburkholderia sp. RAU6.4a]|uniref:SDR family oxidoreductase n=1 Tax=Paraburkholderia sp. RAU6.4a TaxID=2991067 RepID=UPI003D1F228C
MSADDAKRTILVTGVNGQLGYELARTLQGLGNVVAVDRSRLDLSNLDQIRAVVRDLRPALIVNPAAYTAVDKAEEERDLAMRINGEAPGVLAEEAKKLGAALIHYSTDYVFNGTKEGAYVEDDPTDPQNVYGRSTSWVYGTRGKNFLLTMLRLGADRPELKVVADQFGAPTWCNTIAALSAHLCAQSFAAEDGAKWWDERSGIYHLCAGDSTSWHGFASTIFELADLPNRPNTLPIPATDSPTPARRPANSRMSNDKLARVFGLAAPHWKDALRLCLTDGFPSSPVNRC